MNCYIYYLLSLVSGATATLQAAINSRLRCYIGNPVLASLISFSVGTLCLALLYTAILPGWQSKTLLPFKSSNWWMWTGGLLGAFIVLTTVITAPRIGFANMFSLTIAGQLLLAVFFDQIGFLGNPVHQVSTERLIGVVLLIAGVYMIQNH